jgi:hypothetical protein
MVVRHTVSRESAHRWRTIAAPTPTPLPRAAGAGTGGRGLRLNPRPPACCPRPPRPLAAAVPERARARGGRAPTPQPRPSPPPPPHPKPAHLCALFTTTERTSLSPAASGTSWPIPRNAPSEARAATIRRRWSIPKGFILWGGRGGGGWGRCSFASPRPLAVPPPGPPLLNHELPAAVHVRRCRSPECDVRSSGVAAAAAAALPLRRRRAASAAQGGLDPRAPAGTRRGRGAPAAPRRCCRRRRGHAG